MRRISLLSIISLCFLVSSCELEFAPSGSLKTETAVSSMADLKNAVNGVYQRLVVPEASLSSDMFVYGDYKGTDYDYVNNAGHSATMGLTNQTETSNHADNFYYVIYTALGRANYALDAAAKFTPAASEKAAYESYVAELHAIRGWLHFQAAILFCKLPTVKGGVDMNAENTGVPIADRIFPVDYKSKRATLAQTYKFIVDELEGSLGKLTEDARKGGINKYGAEALLARIYLYLGDNNKSLSYALDVIKNSKAQLYTRNAYKSVWSDVYSSEALVELGVTSSTNSQRAGFGYYANPDGYGEFAFSKEFFDYLQTKKGDVRAEMVSLKVGSDGSSGYFTNKYPGQKGSSVPLYANSPKIVRLSEIYLIAAECILKGGTATGAMTAEYYVNALRTNRIENYTNVSSVTLDDVLEERRLELMGEGHRFFDLVRNNISFKTKHRGDIAPDAKTNLVAFPLREIFVSGGSLVQNQY